VRWFPELRSGGSRRARQALLLAGLLLGLVAEWLVLPGQSLLMAGGDLVTGLALIVCGLAAWSGRPESRVGALLTLTGFAWFFGTFAGSDIAAVAALGAALLTFHRGLLFHAIVTYPGGRLSRGRLIVAVVALGYAYAVIVPVAQNNVATIIMVFLVLAATVAGYLQAAGPERQARLTAVAAAVAIAVPLAAGSVAPLLGSDTNAGPVLWGYEAALVLIAIAFLADLEYGRWGQAAVTKLVVDLGQPGQSGTLTARLARALGDPRLVMAYWVPEANGYLDEAGNPVALPGPETGRAVTVIEHRGERIAALVHDAALLEEPGLVDGVAAAAAMAVSNVRLRADVRRQVAELEASRRRLIEARDAQRQDLQRELADGVARRLRLVRDLLAAARRAGVPASGGPGGLRDVVRELGLADAELQELAAGIHPTLLTERGLGPALTSLAGRLPVPVQLSVLPERLPAFLEAAVYFTCSEALANVAKYAHASGVTIEVTRGDRVLRVVVADDGVGGACLAQGSGLVGLKDRAEALGGRLTVTSPAGAGTTIQVLIPWAPPGAGGPGDLSATGTAGPDGPVGSADATASAPPQPGARQACP
jgi:signal transduction histidine kinase